MNFYAITTGTEILNGRRVDKHFEFLKNELSLYGHELFASLVIKDDKTLIANSFEMVKKDPEAVLFCFGGIARHLMILHGRSPQRFLEAQNLLYIKNFCKIF